MKHDPMLDEAGLVSDPLEVEDDWEDPELDDVDGVDDVWDTQTDPDIATLTRYLAGELRMHEAAQMHRRLLEDQELRRKVQPYLEEWCGLVLDDTPDSQLGAALFGVHGQVWEHQEV